MDPETKAIVEGGISDRTASHSIYELYTIQKSPLQQIEQLIQPHGLDAMHPQPLSCARRSWLEPAQCGARWGIPDGYVQFCGHEQGL